MGRARDIIPPSCSHPVSLAVFLFGGRTKGVWDLLHGQTAGFHGIDDCWYRQLMGSFRSNAKNIHSSVKNNVVAIRGYAINVGRYRV